MTPPAGESQDGAAAPVEDKEKAAQRKLTAATLGELPEELEYTGEFGPELIIFLPLVYWLHRAGLMRGRRVRTYAGMRPFYEFLSPAQFVGKPGSRRFLRHAERPWYLPNRSEHRTLRSPFELWPDYREIHAASSFPSDRPLLVVNNKYCVEWSLGPLNYIPCETLDRLFTRFEQTHQIIYFREGIAPREGSFARDNNRPLEFPDRAVLDRHPEVILFDELLRDWPEPLSYNELKLRLFAHTRLFITSQGGGAHYCSLFGGSLILVLHRVGRELQHSYAQGFYRYVSNPAPLLAIARNTAQFEQALALFERAQVVEGRVLIDPAAQDLLQRFGAQAQQDPGHRIRVPEVF